MRDAWDNVAAGLMILAMFVIPFVLLLFPLGQLILLIGVVLFATSPRR